MVRFFDAISKVFVSRNAEKALLEKGEQALGKIAVVNKALEHGAEVVGKKVSAEELAGVYRAYNNITVPGVNNWLTVGGMYPERSANPSNGIKKMLELRSAQPGVTVVSMAYPERSAKPSNGIRKMLELRSAKPELSETDLMRQARANLPKKFEPYGIKDGKPIDLSAWEKSMLETMKKYFHNP